MSTVQLFRRERLNFARFDDIDREHRDANIDSIFYYAVFYPAIEVVSTLATSLIIWYGGGSVLQQHADARRAGRLPAVLAALLPADQRHVGEVQRPAVGDGLVRADLQAARRAGRDRVAGAAGASRPRRRTGTSCFDHVWFAYNDDDFVLQGRELRGPPRRARRHRRRHRLGQDDADQPAAAVLRREARPHHDRRRRHPQARSRRRARPVQPGAAGRAPLLRHDRRQHPAGQPGDRRRRASARRRARSTPSRSSSGCRTATRSAVAERGSTLSVGQKQLLSFARALAFDPRVLSSTRRRRASTPRPS